MHCASSMKRMQVPQVISYLFAILHRQILDVIYNLCKRALSVSKAALLRPLLSLARLLFIVSNFTMRGHSANFNEYLYDQNVPAIVPPEYSDSSDKTSLQFLQPPSASSEQVSKAHFILGNRFHSSTEPHKSALCYYNEIDLCVQSLTIKTSIQESQNNRKDMRCLRSSCMQSF